MEYLKKLKGCSSQEDFANLLGYSEKSFTHILFSEDIHQRYNQFTIPKKTGGVRTILAPKSNLKILQGRLNLILNECFGELEKKRLERTGNIKYIASHGFRKKINLLIPISKANYSSLKNETINFGIYSNAKKHINKNLILNIDLESFFENIKFSRIVGFFNKNRDFCLDYDIAILLAQVVTYRPSKNVEAYLPQGSPCSPIISNLIGNILDIKMLKLAKKYQCTYTRYADDLTFSTNMKIIPSDLAFFEGDKWKAGRLLIKNISSCGFKINNNKTRVNNRNNRQEVTSLTVNQKVNINRQYYRYTRSMVNEYCSKGVFYKSKYHSDSNKNNSNALNGILSFVFYIKKYNSSYEDLKVKDYTQLDSLEKLYIKFLFHYYFVFPHRTLIIGEGYTDPLHLKLAFHKLHKNSSAYIKFSSLQSTKRFSKIMGLSGGTGLLQKFLTNYNAINKATTIHPSSCIILVDGDTAGESVIRTARSQFKESFRLIDSLHTTTVTPILDFYHIFNNLYIIKLPDHKTIEDLYDQSTLDTKFLGKSFNPSNKPIDTSIYYGKKDLYENIIFKNQDNINFSEFTIVFNTIFHIQIHNYINSLSNQNN